jgi:DNA primase
LRQKLLTKGVTTKIRLAGWQARLITPQVNRSPKYITARGVRKSKLLYGLPRAVKSSGPIVMCEGVTDVWRLGRNAVALFGKSLSHAQQELLLRHFWGRSLVLFLDRDAAKETHSTCQNLQSAREKAGDRSPVVVAEHPDGCHDVGECSRKQAWKQVAAALDLSFDELREQLGGRSKVSSAVNA